MVSAPASPLVVVGTAMKASRERDLAREGLLNLVPQDGVVFGPLDLSLPLDQQLPFHAILHKASDELEYGEDGTPQFGPRVRSLADFTLRHPGISLVDPLEAAAKVINRTELARVCSSLTSLDLSSEPADLVPATAKGGDAEDDVPNEEGSDGSGSRVKRQRIGGALPAAVAAAQVRVQVRAPRSTTVAGFSRKEVEDARERLGCPPPYIVKPVVACGTSDSHCMALVMLPEALEGLRIPLPAVVQEFVNHDATIFKVYVAGDKVFHTVRSSIPNVPHDRANVLQLAPSGVVLFDSLKSLPTSLRPSAGQYASDDAPAIVASAAKAPAVAPASRPNQAVLERLAAHLRTHLGLSLFGFDVVIAASGIGRECSDNFGDDNENGGSGGEPHLQEMVVVDINYFPSYRGAEGAAGLFRAAVLGTHVRHLQALQQRR
ncbi:hypothetical protein Vretimale_4701 [Volvox reticuliferus]|nr:hypothetical protein Vretifemale_3303 [Volvox reticuliferus]GIL99560.1 hypothetical protein Vretimale_4701 [Volvox reticuliferus]